MSYNKSYISINIDRLLGKGYLLAEPVVRQLQYWTFPFGSISLLPNTACPECPPRAQKGHCRWHRCTRWRCRPSGWRWPDQKQEQNKVTPRGHAPPSDPVPASRRILSSYWKHPPSTGACKIEIDKPPNQIKQVEELFMLRNGPRGIRRRKKS